MLKTASLLLICLAGLSCAQEKQFKPDEKKRLGSVTWDLKTHKLIWVVQKGQAGQDGKFAANGEERYEISPDEAIMMVADEKRGFTKEEAASLHKLLDTLSLYCAESVVWWDRGEGKKIDGSGGDDKKMKVDHDQPEPKPAKPVRQAPEWRIATLLP